MCTYIDEEATKVKIKQLEGQKIAYTWKVILIENEKCRAPFQWKEFNQNNVINVEEKIDNEIISFEAFHLCLNKEVGYQLLHILSRDLFYILPHGDEIYKYKLVKVAYQIKDFIAVGSGSVEDKERFELAAGPDTICVRAFNFVDKIEDVIFLT